MGIQTRSARARAVLAAAVLAAAAAGIPVAAAATTAAATTAPPSAGRAPAGRAGHPVGAAAQRAARAYWTPARMAAATPLGAAGTGRSAASRGAVRRTIPSPTHFNGVPTIGALFFTTGTQAHFCTASVVNSSTQNLVLTAAHCVYGSTFATNIAFVPKFHHGIRPFGTWPVQMVFVTGGWKQSHNVNQDFAFLQVAPPPGTTQQIQQVTGALWLRGNLGYNHNIEVVGYNNVGDAPIRCATDSFKFQPSQMKFFCHNYQDGTSGGPWIVNYNGQAGTGTVFGVIGGFEQGGDVAWASYSAYFGNKVLALFSQAEQQS